MCWSRHHSDRPTRLYARPQAAARPRELQLAAVERRRERRLTASSVVTRDVSDALAIDPDLDGIRIVRVIRLSHQLGHHQALDRPVLATEPPRSPGRFSLLLWGRRSGRRTIRRPLPTRASITSSPKYRQQSPPARGFLPVPRMGGFCASTTVVTCPATWTAEQGTNSVRLGDA